jgi:hypothetical protein
MTVCLENEDLLPGNTITFPSPFLELTALNSVVGSPFAIWIR